MIPTIGLIVATYSIARLIQVPLEASTNDSDPFYTVVRRWAISLASIVGGVIIFILALDLMKAPTDLKLPGQ